MSHTIKNLTAGWVNKIFRADLDGGSQNTAIRAFKQPLIFDWVFWTYVGISVFKDWITYSESLVRLEYGTKQEDFYKQFFKHLDFQMYTFLYTHSCLQFYWWDLKLYKVIIGCYKTLNRIKELVKVISKYLCGWENFRSCTTDCNTEICLNAWGVTVISHKQRIHGFITELFILLS